MAELLNTNITGTLNTSNNGNIISSLNGYVFHGDSNAQTTLDNYGGINVPGSPGTYSILPIKVNSTGVNNTPLVTNHGDICRFNSSNNSIIFRYSGNYIVFVKPNYYCTYGTKNRVQFALFKNGAREAWSTSMIFDFVVATTETNGNEREAFTYPVHVENGDYIQIGASSVSTNYPSNVCLVDIVIMKI